MFTNKVRPSSVNVGPGELRVVQLVAGDRVGRTAGDRAEHVRGADAVLGQHERAPRRDGDVVRAVEGQVAVLGCRVVVHRGLLVREVRDERDGLVGVGVEPHHAVVLDRVGGQVGGVEGEAVDDVHALVGAPDSLELLAAGDRESAGLSVHWNCLRTDMRLAVALGHLDPLDRERPAELGGGQVGDIRQHRTVVHDDRHRGERAVGGAELVGDALARAGRRPARTSGRTDPLGPLASSDR